MSLYAVTPCRVLDTRNGNGAFNGELTVNVAGSPCAPPTTAQGFIFNATVIPVGSLGYLTLWPDGQSQPLVSTLNAVDGAITSNMAIVPTNNGKIDALPRAQPNWCWISPVTSRRKVNRASGYSATAGWSIL